MARRQPPAFSLLEVMVALAILAVGLVLLLQVQARSAELAIEAREMTVATMLARGKLYDCQTDLLKKGFSVGDYDADGAFDDEGYPDYFWECHGYKPDMPTADSGDFSGDFNGAAGQLGLGAASDAASASGQNPAQEMGMQFLAPVLSQMSSVLGDSIRELVVIVRWGQGDARREMTVTTHVIDKGPVNQVSAMIQQQTRALGGTSVGGGGANDRRPAADQPAASAPGLPGSPTTPGAPPPPPWGPKG